MMNVMRIQLSKAFLFLNLAAVCANAAESTIFVTKNIKNSPKEFSNIVRQFKASGGEGIEFQLTTTPPVREVDGYYLLVQKWPLSTSKNLGFPILKNQLALTFLKDFEHERVSILLKSRGNDETNAFVTDDEKFVGPLREGVPEIINSTLLVLTSPVTLDILVHEKEHLDQKNPNHILQKFLRENEIPPNLKKKLSSVLSEVMAYEKQYEYLESANITPKLYKDRMDNIALNLNMYGYYLNASEWRAMSDITACSFWQLIKQSLEKMPKASNELINQLAVHSICR